MIPTHTKKTASDPRGYPGTSTTRVTVPGNVKATNLAQSRQVPKCDRGTGFSSLLPGCWTFRAVCGHSRWSRWKFEVPGVPRVPGYPSKA
eukprot:122431-Rhodomonas_salina.1